jgi:hypothetical protein
LNANLAAIADDGVRLREFLADSLALWKIAGTVEAGAPPVFALIRVSGGAAVWVERAVGSDMPCRWLVRWRSPAMHEERSRPCASLVGMLNAVRGALGVESGSAVRIAPAPLDA